MKRKTLINVHSFLIEDHIWVVSSNENRVKILLSFDEEKTYDLSFKPTRIFNSNESSYYIINNLNKIICKVQQGILEYIECDYRMELQKQNTEKFIIYFKENDTKYYGILDSQSFELLWKRSLTNSIKIIHSQIFHEDYVAIYKYLINGDVDWQHPFSFPPYLDGFETEKPTQVEQFIGIYKNELWVLFSNNRFLVLDVATGEELYQIENLKENLHLEGLVIGDVFMDEINNKIKILAYLYYIEIDLECRNTEIKKTHTDGLVIGKGQFYEGDKYVYFNGSKDISNKKSIGNNVTGIFNTDTTEVEWVYTIEEDKKHTFFVDKPQANEKYFGVRDSNDTLHLFDRD